MCVYKNASRNGKHKFGQHHPMDWNPRLNNKVNQVTVFSPLLLPTYVMSLATLSSHWHDFLAMIDCTLKGRAINLSFIKCLFSGILTKKKVTGTKAKTPILLSFSSHMVVCVGPREASVISRKVDTESLKSHLGHHYNYDPHIRGVIYSKAFQKLIMHCPDMRFPKSLIFRSQVGTSNTK